MRRVFCIGYNVNDDITVFIFKDDTGIFDRFLNFFTQVTGNRDFFNVHNFSTRSLAEKQDKKNALRMTRARFLHSVQEFYFLKPPKRFWNLSIRPPVSTVFCLPV